MSTGVSGEDTAADGDQMPAATLRQRLSLAGILAAIAVILEAAKRFIDAQTWEDISFGDELALVTGGLFAAAAVLALDAIVLVRNAGGSTSWRWFIDITAVMLFSAIVLWAYFQHDPRRLKESISISAESSWSFDLDEIGSPGDRYVIGARPTGSLEIVLKVRRSDVEYEVFTGPEQAEVVFDRTLAGDGWRLIVEATNDTSGSVEIQGFAKDSETVSVPETVESSLADNRASHGYVLTLDTRQKVYIALVSQTDDFKPTIEMYSSENVKAAFIEQIDSGWQIFEPLSEGSYVISIQAPDQSTGRFELIIDRGPNGDASSNDFTTPSGRSTVPNIYDLEIAPAQAELSAAGFASVSQTVCSSSVAAGHVRQAYVDMGGEEVVVDAPTEPVEPIELDRGTTVYVKVSNGRPC